jgi:putative membrane protein
MKAALRIGALLGLSALLVLIAHEGAGVVLSMLSRAGIALLWLLPLNASALWLDAAGWQRLIPDRPALHSLFAIASIRQAINRLLPVAGIGGELVGIRLLSALGTSGTWSAASVTVEVLLTLVSQYLFVAIGVLCLVHITGALHLAGGVLLGLAVSLPAIALMLVALRHGSIFERIERFASRVVGHNAMTQTMTVQAAQLDGAVRELLQNNGKLAGTVAWQLAGHLVGSLENWLVLRWLEHPISAPAAIVLESLTMAARTVVFVVPAGLGVQELSLIGLGRLLGLDSELALALSLAKRARELLYGLPAILFWQWIEFRRPSKPIERLS